MSVMTVPSVVARLLSVCGFPFWLYNECFVSHVQQRVSNRFNIINMPKSPRKRAASVAGFLRKILPSNRPEQGGTLRESQNNSGDSGYIDLGLNPEELTQWNIAQDLTPPVHRRAVSLSPTKPRALLHSKEQARQQRRELKASGDYLPVTGFNPWTGGWDVVTPTDTISSDMTSLSTKENIARLRQRVLNAKLAFDSEKKRRESNKAQAKLEKIEKLKEDLRQDQPMKWRQHRGQWSSAAEPKLSPIAQSLNSSTPSSEWILDYTLHHIH